MRVLVTGSSRGIGREIARRFARAGARVVIHGRDGVRVGETATELRAAGAEVYEVTGDVSVPGEASAIVDEAVRLLGGLDAVVNNAGMVMRGRFADTAPEVWDRVVRTNLLGAAYLTRSALPHVIRSGGSIIFISSLVAVWGFPLVSAYAASKAALTAMVESMRTELAGAGVHLGVLYVGVTQNDPGKTILSADGEPMPLAARPHAMSQARVAEAAYRMVARRRGSRVLTGAGVALLAISRLWPGLLRWLLRRSARHIDRMAR